MKLLRLLTLGALLFSGSASAAPIYYTDRTTFEAALTSTLNFESFEISNQSHGTPTKVFSDFTFSESGSGAANLVVIRTSPTEFVTDGSYTMWFDDNNNSIGTFIFNSVINAFGVDLTVNQSSTIGIGGDLNSSLSLASNVSGFFGAIDFGGSFDTISFTPSGGPNIGWDALAYGSTNGSVPEPTTLALMGLGLAGIGWKRRKAA